MTTIGNNVTTRGRDPVIVTVSESAGSNWRFVADRCRQSANWHFVTRADVVAQGRRTSRVEAAFRAALLAKRRGADLVISHTPLMTQWTAFALARLRVPAEHIAFAFNFSRLPRPVRRAALCQVLRSVDRFVIASECEREIYARCFGVPETRFDTLLWTMDPEELPTEPPPDDVAPYVCAVGGEDRDYATLLRASARLPEIPFHVICRPESISGPVPPNVRLQTNVPVDVARRTIAHSVASVIPLHAGSRCGHVTIVSSLFAGVPVVISDTPGSVDYVDSSKTGLRVPPGDAETLATAIRMLWDDPELRRGIGQAGRRFASAHCHVDGVAAYFDGIIDRCRDDVSLRATG